MTIVKFVPLPTNGVNRWALIIEPSPGQDKDWDLEGNEGIEARWITAWREFATAAGADAFIASRTPVTLEDHTAVVVVPADMQIEAASLVSRLDDRRPHSRACGIKIHQHGSACARECPTCGGKDQPPMPDVPSWAAWTKRVVVPDSADIFDAIDAAVDEYRREHGLLHDELLCLIVKGGIDRLASGRAVARPSVKSWLASRYLQLQEVNTTLSGDAGQVDCDFIIYKAGTFVPAKSS